MSEHNDPLKKLYRPMPDVEISLKDTALLVIDMQYLDAAPGYGSFKDLSGAEEKAAAAYYFSRIEEIVLPNIQRLQDAFRAKKMEVIFTVIESLTKDGRDRSREHKRLAVLAPKDSKEAQVLDEIKPVGDEIVIPKTASGVFNATNIDYVLRNLGINTLVVTGVVTNECVETAVRDAADKSYNVILVEDCCAALSKESHENSIIAMGNTYARIMTTDELLKNFN